MNSARSVLRLWRLVLASSPKAFGADPPFAKHAKVERVVLNALAK